MQIGAINGTSFKGLLICRPDNVNYNRVAINTDNISNISEIGRICTISSIVCKDGTVFGIEQPFDIVVNAYEKAAESPDSKVDLTSIAVDI